ncbi:N-formylglutamate amidohydrolase [uncultured Brevundimonas sp.]|uniref:N-formylglutamate amidohydrolase n=1 Tax=uncultured Brevundimonas sp. TaxID=213418 RepID=UPI0030EB18DC|tara:strand:+ start:562 stop:1428 length:867 start_codon:yes stop_codon:yes gene_type:complete
MASEMIPAATATDLAAFPEAFVITPAEGTPGRFIFASPHSGDLYPADMGACATLDRLSLQSAEDALVDQLIVAGPAHGAAVIAGRIGRAYLDLNRDPTELDPALITDAPAATLSAKVAAGFGIVPRLTGNGRPLYVRNLDLAEVHQRISRVHRPYHEALATLMRDARARHGRAILIDWHSMPAQTAGGAGGADVVLGDRYGTSCSVQLTRRLRTLFEGLGWRVALNQPYPGGYSTQLWGQPADGLEAVQIELSRALYLDETTRQPGPGWSRCVSGLRQVIAGLCAPSR